MVKINNIKFVNFRNFANFELSFDEKLSVLFGENGCGKTNILEGISLIAKGRGIRNSNLPNLIKNNTENFLIKCNLEINNNIYDIEISSYYEKNKYKKIIKINDDLSRDSINFLNQSISFISFVPEMERLFQSSPSYRRNFLDRLIFSSKNDYNTLINRYKKNLIERVKILQKNTIDYEWLGHVEKEICSVGYDIYQLRLSQLKSINNNINELNINHKFKYKVELKLKDEFFNNEITIEKYLSTLESMRTYDKQFGGTKIGPHRSDLLARINNDFDASLLSTGQQKTVVLMILLAQCNHLVNYKDTKPILLFDEIGSHLDSMNRKLLLDLINTFDIQFFLTGTDKNLFSFISTNTQFYNITNI